MSARDGKAGDRQGEGAGDPAPPISTPIRSSFHEAAKGWGPTCELAYHIAHPARPPDWLDTALSGALVQLRPLLAHAAAYPTRDKLRTRLGKVREAADELAKALRDPVLRPLLAEGAGKIGQLRDEELAQFRNTLESRVLPAVSAAGKRIRSGKGRDRHLPNPDGLSPRQLCAAYIAVAWQEVRNRAVPHASRAAQEACQQLWTAAGGDDKARWGNTLGAWRGHLERAKDCSRAHEIIRNNFQIERERVERIAIHAETAALLKRLSSKGANK
jgi:hypothetical protein